MIDVDKCVANIHRTDTGDYNVRLILTKAIPEYWAHVVTHAPKAKLWKQRLEHLEQVDMKSGAPPASNVTTKERKVSTITSPPQDSWEDKLVKKIIKLDKRIDASLNKVTPYAPQPCIRHWWVYKCKHAAYVDEECYPHSLHIRNSLLSKCETVDITHNSDALCNYCAVEVSRKYCRDMRSLRQEDLFFEVLTTSRYTYFDMIASRDFEYVASFVAAAAWDKYAAENPIPDESASWKDYSDLVALKVKVTTDAVAEARNHRSALAKGRFDKKWMGEVTTVRPAPNDGPTIDEEDIIYDSDACEEIAEEVGGQGLSMGYRDMLYGDVRTLRQIETVHQAMKVINETYDPNRLDNSEEEDTSTTTECENPSVQIAVSEEENDVIPTNDLGLAIQVTAAEENAELPPRTCVSPTPSDDDWATTVFHSPTRRELQGISLDQVRTYLCFQPPARAQHSDPDFYYFEARFY